jgi:hypothetical protein
MYSRRFIAQNRKPQSKTIPDTSKVNFQGQVLRDLLDLDRGTFQGRISLDLRLSTTCHDAAGAYDR